MDLFKLAEKLYYYLLEHGVEFSKDGYPIITEDMLLKRLPDEVCPFDNTWNRSRQL